MDKIQVLKQSEAQLQAISGVIKATLQKLSSTKKLRARFKAMLRANEPLIAQAYLEWLKSIRDEVLPNLPKMKGKKSKKMVDDLADWKALEAEGRAIMTEPLRDILVTGGRSVVDGFIRKQERFDPMGLEAVAWAQEHAAELVVEISSEIQGGIRAFIIDGIKQGKGIPQIGRELRDIVGLDSRLSLAVSNFQTKLLTDPKFADLSAKQIESRVQRKALKLQRFRTELIAATETADALNEGIRQGYGQIGVKKLERIEDPGAPDEDCIFNNGRIYTLAEASGVLPAHPSAAVLG